MTTSATPSTVSLTPFDGTPVLAVKLVVAKAGDGLSAPLALEPREYHIGDEIDVLLRCKVVKVRHEQIPGVDGLARVHMADTQEATIIDASISEEHLAAQRVLVEAERVRRAEEQGEHELPGTNPILGDPLHAFADGASLCTCGHQLGQSPDEGHPNAAACVDCLREEVPAEDACQRFEPAVGEVPEEGVPAAEGPLPDEPAGEPEAPAEATVEQIGSSRRRTRTGKRGVG